MSLAERVAQHVPYLRRYARALTGSQDSGDRYAAAVLELIIQDPSSFKDSDNDRVELYRLFSSIWGSLDVNLEKGATTHSWEANAQSHLEAIAPVARQALLLTSVEGFSADQAATILSIDEVELHQQLQTANTQINEQVRSQVMIIEDEPLIALDIEQLVKSLGHDVTGIARTHTEAIELAKQKRPGMILADIQLADDSSGIDAVNELLEDLTVPVIFITAFPERLLTGERPEPAFLVTKPFEPDTVKALISQALFFQKSAQLAA